MAVDETQQPRQSAALAFLNQTVTPAAIDGSAALERAVAMLAGAARARPLLSCAAAVVAGFIAARARPPRR